jgi:hypothetical protein
MEIIEEDEMADQPAHMELRLADRMIELTDGDILSRLDNLEDSFVERKTEGDSGDWLKTVIAFANSVPIGYPALLFIGVKDDGTVQGLRNTDSLQKKLSSKINESYPVPYYWSKVLEKDSKKFLAVIVPGSENRPHFAGPSYVRDGSKTVAASEEQFKTLLAQRNSMAYELIKWRGKNVSMWQPTATSTTYHPSAGAFGDAVIVDCNQFYVTLDIGQPRSRISFSLEAFNIGFNYSSNRLELRFKTKFG